MTRSKSDRSAMPTPQTRGRGMPTVAGARAFRRFCTPSLSSHRALDHDLLVERSRFHLRSAQRVLVPTVAGPVQTFTLAPVEPQIGASVLLVHGWTGEASFMSAPADFFRRRGFRSVLVDLPAHGDCQRSRASLFDCARAVADVAAVLGPFDIAFGHSVGALAALVAAGGLAPMHRKAEFAGLVLVAPPDRFQDVTRRFGTEGGLDARGQRSFERRLERLARRPIAAFTGGRLLTEADRPALIIHARDDAEVPFEDGARIAAACGRAELMAVDGLGHRAMLYAPPVARAAHGFATRVLAERRAVRR